MKKFLIFILIVVLGFGGYWFFIKNKKVETRCEDGFRFVPSTQKCEPAIIENKTGEIDFSKVKIKTVSNHEIQLQKEGDSSTYTGKFEDSKDPSIREFVSFDSKEAVKYSDEFVLIPYLFNSGGTGQFVYVGLFEIQTNTHLDSFIVGDRIEVSSIDVVNGKAKINFKDRLLTESFAEMPTIQTQFVIEIKDKKIIPIVQLQNADYSDIEIKSIDITSDMITIKAAMPGTWYFEANARFRILNDSYQEIALGSIQALSDWMTVQKVPFELKIPPATLNYKGFATLIIEADDPRGDEESVRTLKKMYIPIEIK